MRICRKKKKINRKKLNTDCDQAALFKRLARTFRTLKKHAMP